MKMDVLDSFKRLSLSLSWFYESMKSLYGRSLWKMDYLKLIKRVNGCVGCIVLRKFVLWEKVINLIFNGSHLNLTLTHREWFEKNWFLESFDVDDFRKKQSSKYYISKNYSSFLFNLLFFLFSQSSHKPKVNFSIYR